jgi:TolB-like protein
MTAPIFVSYASKDREAALSLCHALENRGSRCWISIRDIGPGENFQVAIPRAIHDAKVMLLVFSAESNNSNEVKKELALAGQNRLIVIPVRVEDVTPGDAFAYELATHQWIDLFEDWEKSIQRLSEQLLRVAGVMPQPAAASTSLGTDSRIAGEGAERQRREAGEDKQALALPDKPSLAVLPFQNMTGDAEQEYFVDGMVQEIITALSRIRWLFVIARNSSFTYKGLTVDVKQVGRELGVRYVLEGSVRKGGGRVRITAQLIEARTGAHVWADRFDGSVEDVFDLQDRVASSVAGVIEPALRQAEIERAQRKRPESLDAYDLYLRAFPIAFATTPQTVDKALDLLERAVEIASDYAAAHALIAWCQHTRYLWGGLAGDVRLGALRHARIAIAAGGDDATALAIAAFVIGIFERDYDTAFSGFARSLALSPSSALALGLSSLIRAWGGDEAKAVEHAERALRLSPFDPLSYLPYVALAYAHFFAGRFEEAAAAAGQAEHANPRFSIPALLRAGALTRLDRKNEVAMSVHRLLELVPDFTISGYLALNFTSPERLALLAEALREVGLPE